MAIKDIFKVSWKTYFNPKAWLGTDEIKRNTQTIWAIVKSTFVSAKPVAAETFDQAMQRQRITEPMLIKIRNRYFLIAILFAILAVASFFSSFYYLFHHRTLAGWVLCIAVTALFGVQAFRFHFWYFQIKHRKLGCTLQEWWHGKTEA